MTQVEAIPAIDREKIPPARGLSTPGWVLGHVARGLVALFFAIAAVMKLKDLAAFAKEIRQYNAVPEMWTEAIANVVPWLELVTVALLVTGFWRRESRILIVGMLIYFTSLKIMVMLQERELKCGCFGDSILTEIFSGTMGIVLNIGLIGCLFYDWWADMTSSTASRRSAS